MQLVLLAREHIDLSILLGSTPKEITIPPEPIDEELIFD